MAPAKKKNFTIELPEECGKVPKLTSLNQSGYFLWDEVDEDLQALVNKHMETMSASMTVGNVVFVLCGQADEKANGNPTQNRYIMFWSGMVCDHKNPAPGKEFKIRCRDGETYCFGKDKVLSDPPYEAPIIMNEDVPVPSEAPTDNEHEASSSDSSDSDVDLEVDGNMNENQKGETKTKEKKKTHAEKKQKKKKKFTKKIVPNTCPDVRAEALAQMVKESECHEERKKLFQQASTRGKVYLVSVSNCLSVPAYGHKTISVILRLLDDRSAAGNMTLKILFTDNTKKVSFLPVSLVCSRVPSLFESCCH